MHAQTSHESQKDAQSLMRRFEAPFSMDVIALMSGTSMDGLDCAHVRISRSTSGQDQIDLLGYISEAYPDALRTELLKLAEGSVGGSRAISLMNTYLGLFYADVVEGYRASVQLERPIDLIASHGQTLYHSLTDEIYLGRAIRSSLQLGEASYLAERFHCPVVSDFRVRDQAAGGLGAPLVPFVEFMLNRNPEADVIFLNIGGISNISYIPAERAGGSDGAEGLEASGVIAFDTGPGNMLIDQAVREHTGGLEHFDRDGRYARRGQVHDGLLQRCLRHPFFELPPPKNAGRENFGLATYQALRAEAVDLGLCFEDFVATLTRLTAEANAAAIRSWTPDRANRLVVSGGGSQNLRMMEELEGVLPEMEVVNGDAVFNYSNDAKEAVAFAYLGFKRFLGETNSLAAATGANHDVSMGKISH